MVQGRLRDAEIGLTLFELTENVRVRRTGADRYVRIKDLPVTRRYAPQAPDEEDLTRDMPTGKFALRAARRCVIPTGCMSGPRTSREN